MAENPGKWWEGPHWFLRTTDKTTPLGATKYWKRKYQWLLLLLLFLVLDSFYFVLFCFVSSIIGVDLYTSFQKCHCFWLEKWDSTYTRIGLLYTRENMVVLDFCGGQFSWKKKKGIELNGGGGLSNIDYSCFFYLITRLPNIYVCMLRARPSQGVLDF